MKNFKDGQKVTHPKYGEGIINIVLEEEYYVVFSEVDTKIRAFHDDFYNQLEAVEDLPNVGEYCYLYYKGESYAHYAKFKGKDDLGQYLSEFNQPFDNISKTPPF